MTFEPLFSAPTAIQIHVAAALLAVVLTLVQLSRNVGGRSHRRRGYAWVCAMAVTSLSSFWIAEIRLIGPFSPIHLLSIYVLYTLYSGVIAARQRKIKAHRAWLNSCAFWGLGVAGLFTLIPDRRLSEILFPNSPYLGFAFAAFVLAAVTLLIRARQAGSSYAAS